MELRLFNCRQSYHVEIRRSKYSSELNSLRKQYIQSVQTINQAAILKQFPASIFELETLISSQSQSDFLFDYLEENFSSMFQQVELNSNKVFRCWANITEAILRKKTKTHQQFLDKYFTTFADTALSLQEFNGFFTPFMSIDVTILSKQQCQTILSMLHRDLESPFGPHKSASEQNDNTVEVFGHPQSDSCSFEFLYRVSSLYDSDQKGPYQMVFRMLYCGSTMMLLKKLVCSGAYRNHYRYKSLYVLTNLTHIKDLDDHYYELLLEDRMLARLKYICQFGNGDETLLAWKLIFNLFCEPNYKEQVIREDYMGLASYFIFDNKTDKEVFKVLCSLFVQYFDSIEGDDELSRFEQIKGFQTIACMLKAYLKLDQVDLEILLTGILSFIKFQMQLYEGGQNPYTIKFRQQGLIKHLISMRQEEKAELNEPIEEILEIFDGLNNL